MRHRVPSGFDWTLRLRLQVATLLSPRFAVIASLHLYISVLSRLCYILRLSRVPNNSSAESTQVTPKAHKRREL